MGAEDFFNKLEYQESPLAALTEFLAAEERFEQSHLTDKMRFVGYVIDIGYDTATIITSDPYKVAVGGIPRGSFLILAPGDLKGLPPHFTLLRVMETAPTPLSGQVQQTYFELHKKSMPELDIWTQSELQWGALKCSVLGMFYPDKTDPTRIAFAGDVNNVVSAHRYRVYAPDEALLDLIVNGLVRPKKGDPLTIGHLRPTENELASILSAGSGTDATATTVKVSVDDFKGARTAMFGKTRLGKSNVVKLLAQAMIDGTIVEPGTSTAGQPDGQLLFDTGSQDSGAAPRSVGQLIFDINGEYANDNEQDGTRSIRSANEEVCEVYALTTRPNTPSKQLRINFYEHPGTGLQVLGSMLQEDNRNSIYINAFTSVELASIDAMRKVSNQGDKTRGIRQIQLYWAILHTAGFPADEARMASLARTSEGAFLTSSGVGVFDPHFNAGLREKVYGKDNVPPEPRSLRAMTDEFKHVIAFCRKKDNADDKDVKSLLEANEKALFGILVPASQGAGPAILSKYRRYHAPVATEFVSEILASLDQGRTVILDLGNANDQIRAFFADTLSRAVFQHQEEKFTSSSLGEHYVQLYFEEAHNLFPARSDLTGVYARFAKEGAKFHIGMTYSTQSPSTIYGELLAQTENFFIGHLSSSQETAALTKLQRAFAGVEEEIMRSRTPGFMRMLTRSHRFVVPVQALLFEAREGA